jgi:hypothetical protein
MKGQTCSRYAETAVMESEMPENMFKTLDNSTMFDKRSVAGTAPGQPEGGQTLGCFEESPVQVHIGFVRYENVDTYEPVKVVSYTGQGTGRELELCIDALYNSYPDATHFVYDRTVDPPVCKIFFAGGEDMDALDPNACAKTEPQRGFFKSQNKDLFVRSNRNVYSDEKFRDSEMLPDLIVEGQVVGKEIMYAQPLQGAGFVQKFHTQKLEEEMAGNSVEQAKAACYRAYEEEVGSSGSANGFFQLVDNGNGIECSTWSWDGSKRPKLAGSPSSTTFSVK